MVGFFDVGALVIDTVGEEVLIMMGVRVVGIFVVTIGAFVGAWVGGRMGDSVVAIGVRVGVRVGEGVVGVRVVATGAGDTLISGSSMTINAGNTIPPLYSTGTTVNWSMAGNVSSSPQHRTGSNVIIQHRMINMKFEYRIKEQLVCNGVRCICS